MIRKIGFFIVGLTVAVATSGQGRIEEGQRGSKRFISEKYGFSIAVPVGWLVDPSNDTPMYFSFSPAQGQEFNHQLRLPRGGAVISVVAQEDLPGPPRSLRDWAAADARGDYARDPPIRDLEMPSASGISEALISFHDTPVFGPDDQSQHTVSIFWEFGGRRFAAHLLYPLNDPKAVRFERVLVDTVRSVRPLRKAVRGV